MMFLQNVGFRWNSIGRVGAGTIFRASAMTSARALRRTRKESPSELLFDPQLYFLDMHVGPQKHKELLATLSTYGWFGMAAPEHDSGESTVMEWGKDVLNNIEKYWKDRVDPYHDWARTVTSCVEFQIAFGVTSVVLPGRLLVDPESVDDYVAELDDAIEEAARITELPLLASVVIDESVLRLTIPEKSAFIEALVDSISARQELKGVYLAIVMATPVPERFTHPRTVGALLRFCKLFGKAKLPVIVNFAESLGLACLAVGAYAYGSGYFTKDRRLALSDHVKRKGGFALPKFYSKNLILDLRPESDLERLHKAGLLSLVASDETRASEPLLKVLSAGKKSSTVPAWEQARNRTQAAELHYLQLQHREGAKKANVAAASKWLRAAEANWGVLSDKFKTWPLSCEGAHVAVWRSAFEAAIK